MMKKSSERYDLRLLVKSTSFMASTYTERLVNVLPWLCPNLEASELRGRHLEQTNVHSVLYVVDSWLRSSNGAIIKIIVSNTLCYFLL